MSPEGVTRLLGPIRTEKLKLPNGRRSPHGPNQVVQTPDFSGLDYSLLLQVRVIDFGEAFLADHPPPSLGVPLNYFPPELCFGYLPSKKSDVWQLACILYQIHTVKPIFPTFFRIFEMLIGTIVPVLGPIPQHWRRKYNFDKYGYVEPRRELDSTEPEYWFDDNNPEKSIDIKLAQHATHLSALQRNEVVDLLRGMFAYEPGERLSAVDVIRRLESPSILSEDWKERTTISEIAC